MAEHETCIGSRDDWYTPQDIFAALSLTFDLDPCSPGAEHWVPARKVYTKADDGLAQPWAGLVFMNPPFGGRNGHVPWLRRFLDHGNGIAIVRAYTSSGWFHDEVVPRAETLLFPRGKTKFVPAPALREQLDRKALQRGGNWHDAPGHGVVLIGMGDVANDALQASKLGLQVVVNWRSDLLGKTDEVGACVTKAPCKESLHTAEIISLTSPTCSEHRGQTAELPGISGEQSS